MSVSLDAVRVALQSGDFTAAKRLCRELIASGASSPAWQMLAAAEQGLGDRAAARQALENAAGLAPDDPGPPIQLARLDMAEGRREQAVARLRAVAASPTAGPAHVNTAGEGLGNLGLIGEAERCFRQALASDPTFRLAQLNLALARLASGDPDEAAGLLRSVVGARPDLAPAWLHLGGALNSLGRYGEAAEALRRNLRLEPGNPVALTWLGAACQHMGEFAAAERQYRAALAADASSADANANLGKLLQAQGDRRGAATHFERALDSEPGHVQARSGLAAWLDNEGRYEEALALTDPDEAGIERPELAPIRARIMRHLGRPAEALEGLRTALAHPRPGADISVQLRFSLAAALDETGEYEEAWAVASEANGLRRSSMGEGISKSDIDAMEAAVAALKRSFTAEKMPVLSRSGCDSERPVFVVGMPRSGKSLVEQVLCSHRDVRGAGELTIIGDASVRMGEQYGPWPESASLVETGALHEMAGMYLDGLSMAVGDEAARVIDTMPFNFVHLGLIEMLFPRARVIHCVRHPMDLLLRCYFKNFAGRTLSFAFSLDDLARYFGLYWSLMQHWAKVSGLRMHLVRYEDFVTDTQGEARRMVDLLGLDWDPDCLRFYETGVPSSAAPTPLRCPLDDREVGAWRHYESALSPIAERLPVSEYERIGF